MWGPLIQIIMASLSAADQLLELGLMSNESSLIWPNSRFGMQFSWSMSEILWQHHLLQRLTLTYPQNFDLDCLVVSFPVQWTQAHWSAGKRWCTGTNGERCASAPSCWYGKLLFDNRRMSGSNPCSIIITVIHSFYFSTWLHKHKVTLSDIDQLKCMLIDCWAQVSQDTLTQATDQLPKDCLWLSRSKVHMFNFIWTNRVCKWLLLFYCMLNENE